MGDIKINENSITLLTNDSINITPKNKPIIINSYNDRLYRDDFSTESFPPFQTLGIGTRTMGIGIETICEYNHYLESCKEAQINYDYCINEYNYVGGFYCE